MYNPVTMTPTIAVQYLETIDPREHTPEAVRERLQAACDLLPVSMVLLGWKAPRRLVDVCAQITARHGARLFLWHPLLCEDSADFPLPDRRTMGLSGESLPGYRDQPEFTFICPNQPAAREAALEHLEGSLRGSPFQGVFLDRIRFPSPAAARPEHLACFCSHCHAAASREDLDLDAIQSTLAGSLAQPEAGQAFVASLFNCHPGRLSAGALDAFLDFRQRSITRLVLEASGVATSLGMAVGLDCFSPCLTRMVGQDLAELNRSCEWIKIMTYTHTLAPAGLPFELLGLADWLVSHSRMTPRQALLCLADASGLPLPGNLSEIRADGLPAEAITAEIRLGRSLGVERLFAGAALVDLPGVNSASAGQHAADLTACRSAGADGWVLSWDLWHISPARLEQVARFL